MALRSPVAAKLPPPPSSSSSSPKLHFSKPAITHFRRPSISLPTSTISFLTLFTPFEARAVSSFVKEDFASSLSEAEKTIEQAAELSFGAFDTAASVLSSVGDALKPAVEFAVPIVKQVGEQALKIASPVASEVSRKALEVIQSSGIDTQPVVSAAKTVAGVAQQSSKVIEGAKPIASSTLDTLSSTDPLVLFIAFDLATFAFFLLPSVWSAVSYKLRGYKGDITAAQALDLISTKNHVMIDIRSEKDKDKAGIPRLPSNAKNQMVSIPYSDSAKMVARTLTNLGFKNCLVIGDGFSGGRGWLQSRLGIDSYNVSFAEVISPSRVISAATKRFGTTKLLTD
ncbi:Calcium sensing receptor, chloroplastic [Linum perenne]